MRYCRNLTAYDELGLSCKGELHRGYGVPGLYLFHLAGPNGADAGHGIFTLLLVHNDLLEVFQRVVLLGEHLLRRDIRLPIVVLGHHLKAA